MKYLLPILIIIIYLIGNVYVFQRVWSAMPPNIIGRIILVFFATLVVVSLILSFTIGEVLPLGLTIFMSKIGTSWMFILLYLVIIFVFQDLLGLANKLFHFMPSDALTRYTKENWVGLSFTVGFVALLMICGYLKYQWKVRVPIAIKLDTWVDNTGNAKSLRIVAISDLHLGYNISKSEFETWIDLINKENADIILIAGDIVDNSTRPLIENNYAESFAKLKAPLGIYACLGNHEYIGNAHNSIAFYKQANIKMLKDSVAEIDSSFYVVGRDDKSNSHRQTLSTLINDVDKSKPIILLDHQPFQLNEAVENGINIQLSGHTHQGQVWPISLITKYLYELDHGYKQKENTHVIVSSGIGVWGGKFRIGTQSEYIVIDINK